jgi:hypothetical protein
MERESWPKAVLAQSQQAAIIRTILLIACKSKQSAGNKQEKPGQRNRIVSKKS